MTYRLNTYTMLSPKTEFSSLFFGLNIEIYFIVEIIKEHIPMGFV